jgi:hypothetical protein
MRFTDEDAELLRPVKLQTSNGQYQTIVSYLDNKYNDLQLKQEERKKEPWYKRLLQNESNKSEFKLDNEFIQIWNGLFDNAPPFHLDQKRRMKLYRRKINKIVTITGMSHQLLINVGDKPIHIDYETMRSSIIDYVAIEKSRVTLNKNEIVLIKPSSDTKVLKNDNDYYYILDIGPILVSRELGDIAIYDKYIVENLYLHKDKKESVLKEFNSLVGQSVKGGKVKSSKNRIVLTENKKSYVVHMNKDKQKYVKINGNTVHLSSLKGKYRYT